MPFGFTGRAVVFFLFAMPGIEAAQAFGPLLTSSNLGSGTSALSEVLAWDPVRGGSIGLYASGGGLTRAQGIAYGPDGNLYVASQQTGEILRFAGGTGKFLGSFASVLSPVGITFGPDRNLYVVSNNPDSVVRCNGTTGTGCTVFASATGNSLSSPFMPAFGPDGNLYVASTLSDAVLKFNGTTGTYMTAFASAPNLGAPTGILFTSDGSLLVSDLFNSQILRFDGATGNYVGVFASAGPLNGPSQLAAGPNGDIYVANAFGGNVVRYDASGNLIDTVVGAGAGEVDFLAFAPAEAPPAISSNGITDGIVNAASFRGGAIAPGEILTIFGVNMGPPRGFIYQIDAAGRVAGYTAGTRVLIDGVEAPVLYTQENQVSAIVSYEIAGRAQVSVAVEYLGQASLGTATAVALAAPGIFSAAQNGTGQGAILLSDGHTVNSTAHPAARGSIVSIFATGEGQTNPSGVDGEFAPAPAPMPQQVVSVTIGGAAAEVVYAGGSPGSVAGLVQINVAVPEQVAPGAAPVVVTIGGISSQAGVTLSVE